MGLRVVKVDAERIRALLATLFSLAGLLVYIAFRFQFSFGVGAVPSCWPRATMFTAWLGPSTIRYGIVAWAFFTSSEK